MKLTTLIALFLLVFQLAGFSQPPGNFQMDPSKMTSGAIGGMVVASDETPFEYANVVVNDTLGNMIKGLITNAEGKFMVKGIPFDQPVNLEISFIGFIPFEKQGIIVSKEQPFHKVGKLVLEMDEGLLDEVVIKGEKSIIQTSLDKKTYNVEKSSITKSKSVSDVLNELPSVSVETDGTITLRGNSNVRILVDGESSISQSGEIELILQQMPAESVEKIDLITNPSAKYDPEGTAGIINIILKKEKNRGVNGTVSAGLGTFNKYNASTFISYRKNKLGLTANYNFRYYDSEGEGFNNRTTTIGGENTYLNQNYNAEFDNMSHFGRLGFNISANEKNTISFGGLSTFFSFNRDSKQYTTEEDHDNEVIAKSERLNLFNGHGRFTNANIYHTYNFNEDGANMKYGVNYSNFNGEFDGGYKADSIYMDERYFMSDSETEVDAISHTFDGVWDFTIPVNESITEEFGVKSTMNRRVGDFFMQSRRSEEGPYATDWDLLNDYSYVEQIHAVYFNHIHSIKNFSYQVGLRLEEVLVDSRTSTYSEEATYNRNYFSYYPSIFLRQKFGKDENSMHELQLSYSKRVNRPSFRITNPFRDFSDPQNPREGNPFLQPEFINSFELGYNKIWPKVTFNSSVFYKLTTDLWTRVVTLIDEEENILLTSYDNIGQLHEVGFELVNKYKVLDWWDIGLDFNIAQNIIKGTGSSSSLSNESLTYGGKATSTMNVWKGLEIQVIGRYRGPRVSAQGERDGYGTLDVSLKQDILKERGTITFSANDLANTAKRAGTQEGDGFIQVAEDKRETRVFWLTFSYGFGKMGAMFNKRAGRRNGNGGGDDGDGEEGVF